ncbi:MAG TPA: hypothetical protein VJ875_03620 [Pyrinomonadaceae bacterium]|nr:hypothetical protein [Pyrinomonadaceae bacterium]
MNDERFDETMLTRALQALAAEMEQLSTPPEIETKLLDAFRAQQHATLGRQVSSRYWWAAAVAAMLLIALSVVAIRWRSEGVNDIRQTQTTRQVSPEPVKDVEHRAENVTPKRPTRKRIRPIESRRPQNTEVANHAAREIATDFIPLSYMNLVSLQDGGQIVRVELPRSALVNFGLPVNMDRYNEKVKADVLLGVDGLAHAIRFVQ